MPEKDWPGPPACCLFTLQKAETYKLELAKAQRKNMCVNAQRVSGERRKDRTFGLGKELGMGFWRKRDLNSGLQELSEHRKSKRRGNGI